MSNTLLPCPFCGGEANLDELTPTPYNDQHSTYYSVGCINCGIGFYENTEDEAIAAWNRRADARQLALKTRVCPMCEDYPDGCPVEAPNDSRNKPENEPLTLDELQGMVGEWVWVEVKYKQAPSVDGYAFVATPSVFAFLEQMLKPADYGKTWLAYRRKP